MYAPVMCVLLAVGFHETQAVSRLLLCADVSSGDFTARVQLDLQGLYIVDEDCSQLLDGVTEIMVSRSGVAEFQNLNAVATIIERGIDVFTEFGVSDDIFNMLVPGGGAVQGPYVSGGCLDDCRPLNRINPDDDFWIANPNPDFIGDGTGCGFAIDNFPGFLSTKDVIVCHRISKSFLRLLKSRHCFGSLLDISWATRDTEECLKYLVDNYNLDPKKIAKLRVDDVGRMDPKLFKNLKLVESTVYPNRKMRDLPPVLRRYEIGAKVHRNTVFRFMNMKDAKPVAVRLESCRDFSEKDLMDALAAYCRHKNLLPEPDVWRKTFREYNVDNVLINFLNGDGESDPISGFVIQPSKPSRWILTTGMVVSYAANRQETARQIIISYKFPQENIGFQRFGLSKHSSTNVVRNSLLIIFK